MKNADNIFLIGPMGAGKSTIGRQIANVFGLPFEDSDTEIQRRTGVDITTIFEFEGESGFRARERRAIDDLTQKSGLVLATGGGVILDAENRKCLMSRGVVIYLHCTPEQQYERTYRDRSRPLLQTEDPLRKLKEIMDIREPLYRQTADFTVITEKRSAVSVTKEISQKLETEYGFRRLTL